MKTADWIQVGVLTVYAGLLLGLIVQIRLSTRTRREDLSITRRRATLDAWSALVRSIREAETFTRTYFGRGQLSRQLAVHFLRDVSEASERRSTGTAQGESQDIAIISANEALRALLNAAEDFATGVDLGAYDLETARRVGGWRLARLLNRHLQYVELLRDDADEEGIYRTLQSFAEDFLATHGKRIDDIPMLIGHGYAVESIEGASGEGTLD